MFSDADEDAFGGATPPTPPKFATPAGWYFSSRVSRIVQTTSLFPPERIFLNEHRGSVNLQVDVAFEADLNSPEQPYVGQATVTVRNLTPTPAPAASSFL